MSVTSFLRRATSGLTSKIPRAPLEAFLKAHASAARTLDVGASIGSYAALFPNRVGVDIDRAEGVHVVSDAHCLGDRKSTRLNSSHVSESRMPSSA